MKRNPMIRKTTMFILEKLRNMDPFLIEVRCNLPQDAPEWQQIESLTLEIGYPGIGGKTIWKSIGWLQDKTIPIGRSFAHALWKPNLAAQVLVFDFLPMFIGGTNETEKRYRVRELISTTDGRRKTAKTGLLRGVYSDEFFTLQPQYPGAKSP
ncbi:MAG: hypothetical protein JNJ57_19770 [Saprospiraceae bacterium]|nr:hypothetical protein [Saprospiraceae bacterium]